MVDDEDKTLSKEPTLRDIKKHLERQDRQTIRAVYLAGAIFGGSVILVAISLWVGRMVPASGFVLNYGFLIAAGFAFMSWCWYKQRKIKH